jgi:hypothetical protein
VFQVQDEIATAVTRALKLELAAGRRAINTPHTSNTEAYNQYLLGRQFYQRETLEDEELAIKAFRRPIDSPLRERAPWAQSSLPVEYRAKPQLSCRTAAAPATSDSSCSGI